MPYGTYDPGIRYDPSPIAQGLSSMGQSLAQGLQEYAQKKKQKEMDDKASMALENILTANPEMAAQIGVDPKDKKAWKAGIEALGGPTNAIKFSMAMQEGKAAKAREAREAELAAAQLAGVRAANEKHARDEAAAQAVFAPPESGLSAMPKDPFNAQTNGPDMADLASDLADRKRKAETSQPAPGTRVARYVSHGGGDPAMLRTLGDLDEIDNKRKEPRAGEHEVTLSNGRKGFVDANGNFHDLEPKPGTSKVEEVVVGGKKRTLVGSHLLDENGEPVATPKELNPLLAQAFTGQLQSDLAQLRDMPSKGSWLPWKDSDKELQTKKASLQADVKLISKQLGEKVPEFSESAAPAPATAAPAPTTKAAPAEPLYTVSKDNQIIPKRGADLRALLTQAVKNGDMSDEQARKILADRGFSPKGK